MSVDATDVHGSRRGLLLGGPMGAGGGDKVVLAEGVGSDYAESSWTAFDSRTTGRISDYFKSSKSHSRRTRVARSLPRRPPAFLAAFAFYRTP